MAFPRGRRTAEMLLAFIAGLAAAQSALAKGQSCAEDAGEGCSGAIVGDAVGLLQHSSRSSILGPKDPKSQQVSQQASQKPVQPSKDELEQVVTAFPKELRHMGSDEMWSRATELAGLEVEVQTVENSKIESQMPYTKTGDKAPSGFHGIFWLDQWHTSSVCTKEYNRQRPFPHTPSQETLVSFGDKGTEWEPESGCLGPVPGYGGHQPHWTFTNTAGGSFQLAGGSMSSKITANFCFDDKTKTEQGLDVVVGVLAGNQWLFMPTWLARMRMERTEYGWNRITVLGPNVSQTLNKYGKFLKYGQGVLQTFFDIVNVGDSGAMQYPVVQVVDGDGHKTKYWDEYMQYVSGPKNDHKDTQLAGVYTPQFTPRYEQKCFGFIGKLCGTRPCPEDSNSVCQRGKCMCRAGCAGTDGKCYAEENKLIATRFDLRNARWPEHHLYVKDMSLYQQMGLTDHPGAEAKFSLYSMPSKEGGNGYILASDKLANNETVAMVTATHGLILRLEPQALFAESLHEADLKGLGPKDISLTVCSLRSETRPGTVMIGGGNPMAWVLGKKTSWEVFAHENAHDLDDSSHWLTDPPIPESALEACNDVRKQGQSAKR